MLSLEFFKQLGKQIYSHAQAINNLETDIFDAISNTTTKEEIAYLYWETNVSHERLKKTLNKTNKELREIAGAKVIKIECPHCHINRDITVRSRVERDELNEPMNRECKVCRAKIMERYKNPQTYKYED